MTKLLTALRRMLLALALGTGYTSLAQTYNPITLTAGSFTTDVVANGQSQANAGLSTTGSVDNGNYRFLERTFSSTATASTRTQGLPPGGLLTSASTSGLTFQLASYTGNNALRLATTGASGTLAFATPRTASELYVLANAGNGPMTANITVNFDTPPAQTFTGVTIPDWYLNSQVLASGTATAFQMRARVPGSSSTVETGTNDPRLYQIRLAISAANQAKNITGVTITQASGTGVTVVMGVSATAVVVPCAGTPPAVAASSVTSTCGGTSFTLTASGPAAGTTGLSYQWQSRTGTNAFANITANATGATSAVATITSQTVATDYQVLITCANGGAVGTSNTVSVAQNSIASCYCQPSSSSVSEYLSNVTLNDINNSTSSSVPNTPTGYADYTASPTATQTTTLNRNARYPVTITAVDNRINSTAMLWIDYDQSGTFDATNSAGVTEFLLVGSGPTSGSFPQTLTFANTLTIPASAVLGTTRMRVRWHNDASTAADACALGWNGETEDYLVTIGAEQPCSGAPAVTVSSTTMAPCAGTSFTLVANASGASGVSYQWQSRTGTNAFANISGATSLTYSTSQTVATDYRVVATCTNGGASAPSAPLTVAKGYLNCYCAVVSTGTGEYIKSVTFPGTPGFTNTTGANSTNGTGDFTGNAALTTTLNQGATYLNGFSITARVNSNGAQGAMWIDYDHSGTFDATEYIALGGGDLPSHDQTLTTTLTVPPTALTGPTRVRVRWRNSGIAPGEACTSGTTTWFGETEDYLITIAAPATCTAPPSTVVAAASTANACANSSFTLSTSSIPTTLGGYTFQWQSSPAGAGTFTDISGATTQTYTVSSQTAATDYQLVVSCQFGGTPVTSNIVAVGQNAFDQCYCTTTHAGGCGTYGSISNVSIGTLNNSSGCTAAPGYVVYPVGTATTNLNSGTSAALTLTIANPSSGYRYAVWIDFNQNGTFETSEYVANGVNGTTATRTATIAIPATALAGATRMRVRTKAGIASYGDFGAGDACAAQFDGETEDYTVTIVAPTACTGTPPTAAATASTVSVCTGTAFTLTGTFSGNISGLTYQWQSSPAGAGTFADISGATSLSYSVTSQTAATDYRLQVTCTAGGQTSTSNTASVGQNSFVNCYCTPTGGACGNEYLRGVSFNTLSNLGTGTPGTGCTSGGYADYTGNAALTTTLMKGASYPLTLNLRINSNPAGAGVWIDYNHNSVFEASEYTLIYSNTAAASNLDVTRTTDVLIPGTALTGVTRMRVRSANSSVPVTSASACTNNFFGEVEDYLVTISGDLVVSSAANVPAGDYSSITVTGPNGNATLTGAVTVSGAVTVQSGAAFNDNCNVLSGAGSFTAAAGSTLRVCNTAGISASGASGAVQVAGTRSFSDDASYVYNGTAAQTTGTGLPTTVLNLMVNNATGVTLTQSTGIERMLTLASGNLRLGSSNLTLLSDASGTALVVNSGSGVVQNTGSGVAIMQRAATPSTSYAGPGYRHYSSPMTATPLGELGTNTFSPFVNPAYNALPTPNLPLAQFPNVFDYQESRLTATYPGFDIGWHSPASPGEGLTPGKGYTVNIAPQLVDLSGVLNTGPVNTGALTHSGTANSGWQLLGNPYPAPLDWNLVTAASAVPTGMDAAVYIFEPTAQYGGFYRSYVNNAGTGGFTGVMAAMQGFFVRTSQSLPAGFNFQNAYRLTSYANPAFYRSTADTRPMLRLGLSGSAVNGTDETVVYLQAGATTVGVDKDFDAAKISNPSGLSVATRPAGNTEALAINGLPLTAASTETRLPLALTVPAAGAYHFNVAALAHFDPSTAVLLLDHQLNTRTDLRQVSSYAFSAAQAGALNGRFELLLGRPGSVTATAAVLASQFSVWPNPATEKAALHVTLDAPAASAKLTLRTLLGQKVTSQTFGGGSTSLPIAGLAAGTYLLTVQVAGQATATRRVVVE